MGHPWWVSRRPATVEDLKMKHDRDLIYFPTTDHLKSWRSVKEITRDLKKTPTNVLLRMDWSLYVMELWEDCRDLVAIDYPDIRSLVKEIASRIIEEREQKTFREIARPLPDNFKAGMLYTTPEALANSGLTNYSYNQIRYLFENNKLKNAAKIGNQIILTEEDVNAIVQREVKRHSGEAPLTGIKPGTKVKKRGRRRRSPESPRIA
jgi:hypothetical protein